MRIRPLLISLLLLPVSGALAQVAVPAPASTASKAPELSKLDPAMGTNAKAEESLEWHDVTTWGVEGRILPEQERLRWFDRLPASARTACS